MITLVIHPFDVTTGFLAEIYEDKDFEVIDERVSKSYLRKRITASDRVLMLGHGTPDGLLGFGHMMIDSNFVQLLRTKECICVWCNADQFVKKYNLTAPFYTGMFISEESEAELFNISATTNEIARSNNTFASLMSEAVSTNNYSTVKESYNLGSGVCDFNRERLYVI